MSDEKKVTEEEMKELNKALQEISSQYYKGVIELLVAMGNLDDMNYVRTAVHMPNGGEYLLALMHVSGPRLSLKRLARGGYDNLTAEIDPIKVTPEPIEEEL